MAGPKAEGEHQHLHEQHPSDVPLRLEGAVGESVDDPFRREGLDVGIAQKAAGISENVATLPLYWKVSAGVRLLVPEGVVTVMPTVPDPAGAIAVISVSESTVKHTTLVLPYVRVDYGQLNRSPAVPTSASAVEWHLYVPWSATSPWDGTYTATIHVVTGGVTETLRILFTVSGTLRWLETLPAMAP